MKPKFNQFDEVFAIDYIEAEHGFNPCVVKSFITEQYYKGDSVDKITWHCKLYNTKGEFKDSEIFKTLEEANKKLSEVINGLRKDTESI